MLTLEERDAIEAMFGCPAELAELGGYIERDDEPGMIVTPAGIAALEARGFRIEALA